MDTMDTAVTFGDLLRQYRAAAGLTQSVLAERAALSRRAVAELERGARGHPRPATVWRLATALGLDDQQRAALETAAARGVTREAPVAERMSRLPRPISHFVGREAELDEVIRLLRANRLVTLVGTGGIGKTRLALEAARAVETELGDGARMVDLSTVTDPALVPQAVAAACGVREEADHALVETLREHLRRRRLLLLVDNCEHLLAATTGLVQVLLSSADGLRVLATSRQALDLAGEVVWRVPPLGLPRPDAPVAEIITAEAVRLFVERAAATSPDFHMTSDNAAAVVGLCRQLDGIPLAIELAAARARVLSVEQISWHLGDRSLVLRAPSHVAAGRHATLRATIDWSHSLLSDAERALFRRLAVFAGDFGLEAVTAVCADPGLPAEAVIDLLGGVIDKSLVVPAVPTQGEARYHLLETLRQYALERLRDAGEEPAIRDRHLAWLVGRLQVPDPIHGVADEPAWLAQVALEYANCRAALEWAARTPAAARGLRLALNLYRYWLIGGLLSEGRRWGGALRAAVAAHEPRPSLDVAWSLTLDAVLTLFQGDFVEGLAMAETAVAIAQSLGAFAEAAEMCGIVATHRANLGDLVTAAAEAAAAVRTLRAVGEEARLGPTLMATAMIARLQGDTERAIRASEEAYALLARGNNRFYLGHIVSGLGLLYLSRGDTRRARAYFDEALAARRAIGERGGILGSLRDLGQVALAEGDLPTAEAHLQASLVLARDMGDRADAAQALRALGNVARERGDLHAALGLLQEGLHLQAELRHTLQLPDALEEIAQVASRAAEHAAAVHLCAAAVEARRTMGVPHPGAPAAVLQRARRALGEQRYATACAAGRAASLEQAIDAALRLRLPAAGAGRPRPGPGPGAIEPLTAREREVAALLAEGLSNRAIAERLVISEATAEVHVRHILSKLGAASRAQAAVWAAQRARSG